MKVGNETCRPCRFASIAWPISWRKISTTIPTPNFQPQISAYAATETKSPKNFRKTKPNLTASPATAAIGAQIRLRIFFQSVPRGWTGR